ncbi:MAG: hypothetical protein IPM58_18880 [Nitrospira sp.]|nr:hypothetical protein [Nitrospira sp.]
MLNTLRVPPSCLVPGQDRDRTWDWSCQARLAIMAWSMVVGFCLLCFSSLAWGEEPTEDRRIVAAGFGYQIGSASIISVKVYDAESGATLSDEVYELAVKENGSGETTPGPRIFAGGVGSGATDLSNFMLRVYDAKTGAFQWEGRLNLVQPDSKKELQVSVSMPGRAIAVKTQAVQSIADQPVFLLRAVDAASGLSVWEDEFTTMHAKMPKVQPIMGQSIQPAEISTGSSHTFEFRIRMFDPNGERVLWEDLLSQVESDEGATESSGDRAAILPAWPRQSPDDETPAELI